PHRYTAGIQSLGCGSSSSESYLPTKRKFGSQSTSPAQTSDSQPTSIEDRNSGLVQQLQKPDSQLPGKSGTSKSCRWPNFLCNGTALDINTEFAKNHPRKVCWGPRD